MERSSRILALVCSALSLASTFQASAQRQWGVLDSTRYAVGDDTTLIASRHQLYRALPSDTTLIWDFTDPEEPNNFIRDVDHWSSNEFHVLVGSRYIGGPTMLFKTTDAGTTWTIDTSFVEAATEPPSLNQMTIVGDTAFLFNGYYISEVLRSYDRGLTWEFWFQSLIAHYYGIIPCEHTAFIYGMVGDAFQPTMWQIPDSLWDLQIANYWSGCHNSGAPGCYYAPSIQYPDVVHHFDSLVNALCANALSVNEPWSLADLVLAPNPTQGRMVLSGLPTGAILSLFDARGRPMVLARSDHPIELGDLSPGLYFLHVRTDGGTVSKPFIKE